MLGILFQVFTNYLITNWKHDDVATVRVIFRWLAAQNPHELQKMECTSSDCVLSLLQKIGDHASFYNNVFLEMCQYVVFSLTISTYNIILQLLLYLIKYCKKKSMSL